MVDDATTDSTVVEGTAETVATTTGTGKTPFIVGEHSVYSDVESLYKGAIQKEMFIQQLQKEKAELSAQLEQLKTDTTLIEQLKEYRKDLLMTDNTSAVENTNTPITDEAIKEIALKAMQENMERQKQAANLQECKSLLGNTAEAIDLALKNKATELGVETHELEEMAATKPQLFKRLFEIKNTSRPMDYIPSSVRTTDNNNQTDAYAEFIKNARDTKYIANLTKKALENPEMLSGWEWK